MSILGFIWLDNILDKLWSKHNVEQDEVEQLFANTPHFRFVETGYREGENVYSALGQTDGGRYLIAFFIYKRDRRALVVSARDMTSTERKLYGQR